jgi:hypothetical protein
MRYFAYILLFFLFACASPIGAKDMKKNKNSETIQMRVITEPSIKIKK